MLKVRKTVSEILKQEFPKLKFGYDVLENNAITIFYDAYMTEDEELKVHAVLDKLGIVYTMERMAF